MKLPEIILLCIIILILLLIIIRIVLLWKSIKFSKIVDFDKCMTIGNREIQEDNASIIETSQGILAVLADGMGKQYGGKIAGRIAVETFMDLFQSYNAFDNPQYFFKKAYNASNRKILDVLDDQRGSACVASAIIKDNTLYYALVGNIKIAVYRDKDLIPISQGHTVDMLAMNKYKSGTLSKQSAVALLEKHRLYNFVGQDGFRDVEIFDTPLKLLKNDIVVLMTDGVYECLTWREIEDILSHGESCKQMSYNIIQRINESMIDNKDNASVILMEIKKNID